MEKIPMPDYRSESEDQKKSNDKVDVQPFEISKESVLLENEFIEDVYESIDFFREHKFDESYTEKIEEIAGNDPRNFFTHSTLQNLSSFSQGERLILLAKVSGYITTRPSDIDIYLDYFPQDAEAFRFFVMEFSDNATDGITFVFAGMLAGRFPTLNNNKQLSEIYQRRELAPNFLLSGYEYAVGNNSIESKFGEASEAYIKASEEASELSFAGDRPFEKRDPFNTLEFLALSEDKKSEMLRLCLGSQQFSLVFEETLNSVFTKESVERSDQYMRQRTAQLKEMGIGGNPHNPAHSMLYGTFQANSSYELPQSRFEYEMNSTAEVGGFVEEYAEHKLTLATIEAFTKLEPSSENVSLLVDFWNKNRNPIFGNAIAEALTIQGPEQAAQELLKLIRLDIKNKNALASVLYRLELGRIGMSAEGVRYMGRLYNLGEYNDPDFFANRLSPEGEMGVFGKDNEMLGIFHLGDLSDEETNVSSEVRAISYELLFKNRGEVSKEERERREKFVIEFNNKYLDSLNSDFFKDTGIRFNNLTLEEQGWFLSFINDLESSKKINSLDTYHQDGDYQSRVKEFVTEFGEEGVRTFLSMEFNRDIGFQIIEKIGGYRNAKAIFRSYNHILLATRETVEQFEDRVPDTVKDNFETSLLRKATEILSESPNEEILQELEKVRIDNLVFTSAFKALRIEGIIQDQESLELLRNTSFETTSTSELTPTDERYMLEIFDKNWGNESSDLSLKVREGLISSFKNPETEFYILRHEGVIVGYARTDKKVDHDNSYLYFGSFNVDSSFGGSKIGDFIYQELLDQGLKKFGRVDAHCDPSKPITKKYINTGFVVTGVIDNYLDSGEMIFEISNSIEFYDLFKTKNLQDDELFAMIDDGSNDSVVIREQISSDTYPEINQGKALTRYFSHEGKDYVVFETLPENFNRDSGFHSQEQQAA